MDASNGPRGGSVMDDETRVAEIRERAARATEGPWEFFTVHDETVSLESKGEQVSVIDAYGEHTPGWLDVDAHNAEFIAASREDIPWLLDERAALLEQLRTAEARAVVCEHQSANYLRMMEQRAAAEARAAEAEAEVVTLRQQRQDNLQAIAERDASIAEASALAPWAFGMEEV